jgi:hypothetical protein
MTKELSVFESAPEEVEGIVLSFHPRFGLMVDHFPKVTAFTNNALAIAQEHRGAVAIEGGGKIGGRVRFTVANGEALYELTDRVKLATGEAGFRGVLKGSIARVVGQEQEVKTFNTLSEFTDEWPEYAGFTPHFLNVRPHVSYSIYIVRIQADGVTGEYNILFPHPILRGARIGERFRLRTPKETIVSLPTARARAAPVS